MLYQFLKIWVYAGLKIYCTRIRFDVLPEKGPAILACNHPNSFLDALILGSHYNYPIHFLARGDVFTKPAIARLLRNMNMIPIYRLSEGRAGLKKNEQTFQECLAVLKAGGKLLIFSEGLCENDWKLRPLKKGTARLADAAWHNNNLTDVIIKPVAFSYSSFKTLPLAVEVKEAEPIYFNDIPYEEPAQFYHHFNAWLQQGLQKNMLSKTEMSVMQRPGITVRVLLAIPALIGWLTHRPLYVMLRKLAAKKTTGTVFYHSVLFGLLLIVYPIVLLAITGVVAWYTQNAFSWLLLLRLPFTAWCYKEFRRASRKDIK